LFSQGVENAIRIWLPPLPQPDLSIANKIMIRERSPKRNSLAPIYGRAHSYQYLKQLLLLGRQTFTFQLSFRGNIFKPISKSQSKKHSKDVRFSSKTSISSVKNSNISWHDSC